MLYTQYFKLEHENGSYLQKWSPLGGPNQETDKSCAHEPPPTGKECEEMIWFICVKHSYITLSEFDETLCSVCIRKRHLCQEFLNCLSLTVSFKGPFWWYNDHFLTESVIYNKASHIFIEPICGLKVLNVLITIFVGLNKYFYSLLQYVPVLLFELILPKIFFKCFDLKNMTTLFTSVIPSLLWRNS